MTTEFVWTPGRWQRTRAPFPPNQIRRAIIVGIGVGNWLVDIGIDRACRDGRMWREVALPGLGVKARGAASSAPETSGANSLDHRCHQRCNQRRAPRRIGLASVPRKTTGRCAARCASDSTADHGSRGRARTVACALLRLSRPGRAHCGLSLIRGAGLDSLTTRASRPSGRPSQAWPAGRALRHIPAPDLARDRGPRAA